MVSNDPTSLAPGFRFHPTDEELVRYYLRRKICGKPFRLDAISEIDIYKTEPWDLPCMSKLKTRDLEWYFFSVLDKKYGNGSRTNRATEKGYWKTTGKDRAVLHRSQVVGMKKTLVYHIGRAPQGQRTNWVMHEYRLMDEALDKAGFVQDSFVLCRVFQKSGPGPKNGEQYGAPLIEEEWEDDEFEVFLKVEAATTVMEVGDDAYLDENDIDQILGAEVQPESDLFAPVSTESVDKESQKFLISLEDYTYDKDQQQPDDYLQKLLDSSLAFDYVQEQLEDKEPYGFEVDQKQVRHEHLEDQEQLHDMALYGFQTDQKQVRNEHLDNQQHLENKGLYSFQVDQEQVRHEHQEHLENKALYEHLEDQEHLDNMSLYDFQFDKYEYVGEPSSNKEALVLEDDTELKNGEQFVDATDDFDSDLGAFFESDDLLNPINVDDDTLGFDMLEEYLNFSDANDGMSDYITFDDSSLVSGDHFSGELPISQDMKEVTQTQHVVSSEQPLEKQQTPSNYGTVFQQHPFMKQATQMLMGNVHAPPAFASEFPDGALLKFQSPASSSAHVTAGMIEIRNSSQVGRGSLFDMFNGKNGLCKIIVSFGMSRGDDHSTTLESAVRILPGKAVSGLFGGGGGGGGGGCCFYLMLLSILVVSLSCKMGCLIFSQ